MLLPPDERATLATIILDTLEPPDPDVDAAWDAEIARRLDRLRAGKATLIPWETVRQKLLNP